MRTSESLGITEDNLPALFRAADSASMKAQRQYSRLTAADLGFLVLAAILGSVALSDAQARGHMAMASAGVLAISIIVTWIIRTARFGEAWYDGRAVAESVKSLTWRYMTCTEPYSHSLAPNSVDQRFLDDLKSVLTERPEVYSRVGGRLASEPQITKRMRELRRLNTDGRKDAYLSYRVCAQREWYGTKSEANRRSSDRLYWSMIAAQVLALISAIALVRWPESTTNPIVVFVALGAAFLAWLQFRRHQELAQSYGLTAQELGLAYEQGGHVRTAEQLSEFVSDSENAISREHTLWLARRDRRHGQ